MTNGEKIKETFPNMRITVCESYVQVMGENYEFNNTYPLKWWNAEYKKVQGRKRGIKKMSEISEIEIKTMTKAQNYFRGYWDGKSDVLGEIDKMKAEIEQSRQTYEASMDYGDAYKEQELSWVLELIDKYIG